MVLPPELTLFLTSIVAWTALYLIVSLSLNLEFGFTGIPNFGKALTVMGGAYVAGYLPGRIIVQLTGIGGGKDYIAYNAEIVREVNLFLSQNLGYSVMIFAATILLAAGVGAGLGFIAAYPAIRLREEYLAMSLLAMAEVGKVIGYNYKELVGGTLGVQVPDPLASIEQGLLRFTLMSLIIMGFAVAILLYLQRLVKSPLGRSLRAVRDSELAAETLGKDVVRIKMKVLVLSSVLGAVGGALHAFYTGGVIAISYDRVVWTFWPWVMVLMGGMANNIGTALGVLIFVVVRQLIIFYKDTLAPFIPFDVVWLDYLLLGGVLIAILMLRPEGVLPEKPTYPLSKKIIREIRERVRARISSETLEE